MKDPRNHDCGYVKMYSALGHTRVYFDTGQVLGTSHAQYKSIGFCGIDTSSTGTRYFLKEQVQGFKVNGICTRSTETRYKLTGTRNFLQHQIQVPLEKAFS
jgi:hypothetical protein